MSTASMALLQGSKKSKTKTAAVAAELDTPKEGASAADDEVEVDLEPLDEGQVDALVKDHSIATPPNWPKMSLEAKKEWLTQTLGGDGQQPDTGAGDGAAAGIAEAGATDHPEANSSTSIPSPEKAQAEAQAAAQAVKKGSKKTAGKKGNPVAIAEAKAGEVIGPGEDPIADIAAQIENLKEADAKALVTQLNESTEFSYFRLGGVLSVIQSNGWWAPHPSFKDYVENEVGLAFRRVAYWISIYNGLVEAGIQFSKVKSLGWSKLVVLVPVLNQANADKWIATAQKQTALQLADTVKKAKATALPAPESEDVKTTATLTFKLHSDQKETVEAALAKAKAAASTQVATVALEFICLDYLGTAPTKKPVDMLKGLGLEGAVALFNEAFPDSPLQLDADAPAESA